MTMRPFKNILCKILISVALLSGGATMAMTPAGPATQLAEVSPATLRVLKGMVEISVTADHPVQVVVYVLTGQVVKNITAQPGITNLELAPGYYIVKCDKLSQRVIIK